MGWGDVGRAQVIQLYFQSVDLDIGEAQGLFKLLLVVLARAGCPELLSEVESMELGDERGFPDKIAFKFN